MCCGDSKRRERLALGGPQPQVQIPSLLLPGSLSLGAKAPLQKACSSGLCGYLLMGASPRVAWALARGSVALLLNKETCAPGPSSPGAAQASGSPPRACVSSWGVLRGSWGTQSRGRDVTSSGPRVSVPPLVQVGALSPGKAGARHADVSGGRRLRRQPKPLFAYLLPSLEMSPPASTP